MTIPNVQCNSDTVMKVLTKWFDGNYDRHLRRTSYILHVLESILVEFTDVEESVKLQQQKVDRIEKSWLRFLPASDAYLNAQLKLVELQNKQLRYSQASGALPLMIDCMNRMCQWLKCGYVSGAPMNVAILINMSDLVLSDIEPAEYILKLMCKHAKTTVQFEMSQKFHDMVKSFNHDCKCGCGGNCEGN